LQTPFILIRLFPATSEKFAKLFSLQKSPGASPPDGKRQSSNTMGMRTLRKTGNLRVVQKILGHTDITITAKLYTDATVEDMRAAMEATAPRDILVSNDSAGS
jgi:integrase